PTGLMDMDTFFEENNGSNEFIGTPQQAPASVLPSSPVPSPVMTPQSEPISSDLELIPTNSDSTRNTDPDMLKKRIFDGQRYRTVLVPRYTGSGVGHKSKVKEKKPEQLAQEYWADKEDRKPLNIEEWHNQIKNFDSNKKKEREVVMPSDKAYEQAESRLPQIKAEID